MNQENEENEDYKFKIKKYFQRHMKEYHALSEEEKIRDQIRWAVKTGNVYAQTYLISLDLNEKIK